MFCVTHKGLDSMEKEQKTKDYAFQRQFNEKPNNIPGCLGTGLKAFMPQWSLRQMQMQARSFHKSTQHL